MIYPAITAFYAALFALLYIGLSAWVVAGRVGERTLFGDGSIDPMMRRIRSHANFIEYVPLALIVIGLLEAAGGSTGLVRALLVILLIARILHPIGMFAAANTPRQFACRGGGTISTFLVLLVAAVALLIRVA